jgi:hypothetical protein
MCLSEALPHTCHQIEIHPSVVFFHRASAGGVGQAHWDQDCSMMHAWFLLFSRPMADADFPRWQKLSSLPDRWILGALRAAFVSLSSAPWLIMRQEINSDVAVYF